MYEEQVHWYNQMKSGTGRKSKKSSNYASSLARSFSPGKRPALPALGEKYVGKN